MTKHHILAIFALFLLASCNKDQVPFIPFNEYYVTDQYGRILMLRGMSTSNFSKFSPDHLPWISESDVEREAGYGFNVSRYVISWNAIEPEKGIYGEAYLDETVKRVEWYTSRGMYVLLDMHQDLYSGVFGGGGNGAPPWAVRTDGIPIGTYDFGDLWYLQYFTPEVTAAFQNFWKYEEPNKDLQDHYIKMWLKVIERFKNNPYVIGYELMNEPHPGDGRMLTNGHYARVQLSAFYDRLIRAIREIDQDKWIFFEPEFFMVTGFGYKSDLPRVKDYRNGEPRLVFSPHIYPPGMEAGLNYGPIDKGAIQEWKNNRAADMKKHSASLFCTEFGGKNDRPETSAQYLDQFCTMLDAMKSGWAAWSHDIFPMIGSVNYNLFREDYSEYETFQPLIRAYPRATAGYLRRFKFEPATSAFELDFVSDASISQPTEISLPLRRYPNGFDLRVSGAKKYEQQWDADKNLLLIWIPEDKADVQVRITAR